MKYYTYITEELPKFLESAYNLKFPREKTFLAGLSMGGYGTLKIGLNHPEMFGAIAPFSAPCNMKGMLAQAKQGVTVGDMSLYKAVLGEDLEMKDTDDPYWLIKKVSELPADQQPRIRLMCGRQDELAMIYKQNVAFDEYAKMVSDGVYENLELIDGIISKYSVARSIRRLSKVVLAVLRLAVYEILFVDGLEVSISINEAIELTKCYATDEEGGFVNGVLGAFVRTEGLA